MAHVLAPTDAGIAGTLALALARAYGTGGGGDAALERARTLAESALKAAPQLADARVALAALHAYDGEGVAAANERASSRARRNSRCGRSARIG